MLYEQFGELKYQYRNREFWCRGYYVDTVGKNESRIAEYIKNQLKEDELGEQLRIPSPRAGRKILCKRFSTKSRMVLESRVDSGLNPLFTESHGGQNGMRAGTA